MRTWNLLAFLVLAGAWTIGCGPGSPAPEPPLLFSPEGLPEARVGVAYEVTIRVSQWQTPVGAILISHGQLPPGLDLTFDPGTATARIGGTPSEAGSYSFTVHAWCYGTMTEGQSGDKDYVLVSR